MLYLIMKSYRLFLLVNFLRKYYHKRNVIGSYPTQNRFIEFIEQCSVRIHLSMGSFNCISLLIKHLIKYYNFITIPISGIDGRIWYYSIFKTFTSELLRVKTSICPF